MTIALCLFCGDKKIGAFSACDKCSHPPSGDESLDLFFTDWHFPEEALEQFGNVAKGLNKQSQSPIPVFREIMLSCEGNNGRISDDETDTSL